MNPNTIASKDSLVSASIGLWEELSAGYDRQKFRVKFWDGTWWGKEKSPDFSLILNHPGSLRKMFLFSDELALGEAFIYGDFDIEGSVESAVEFADFLLARGYSIAEKIRYGGFLAGLPSVPQGDRSERAPVLRGTIHSKERDRRAVTYHYDVSNEFYSLWLDRAMLYSCAYFETRDDDLDRAQNQKMDYICRKLRLQPGEKLLDIGCGWGGLLIQAAKKYGVNALGITLSAPQAEWARKRIAEEGLSGKCRVEICDYRELDSEYAFDKIVSVGMFEHVGSSRLVEYFGRAWRLLRPGGCSSITG